MTIQIYMGDCLEVMANIPDQSVDAIICDLPYGTTQNRWDASIPFEPMWAHFHRICTGAIVLTAQAPFDKMLGASNIRNLKYEWIWEKPRATGHLNAEEQPLKAHENILVFAAGAHTYNPQKGTGEAYKPHVNNSQSRKDTYGDFAAIRKSGEDGTRFPRSVLQFRNANYEGKTVHPTQKPLSLMEYLVKTYTNEGDTVLDPTMGSGTTGAACQNTGRHFIGVGKSPEYFAVAKSRLYTIPSSLQAAE